MDFCTINSIQWSNFQPRLVAPTSRRDTPDLLATPKPSSSEALGGASNHANQPSPQPTCKKISLVITNFGYNDITAIICKKKRIHNPRYHGLFILLTIASTPTPPPPNQPARLKWRVSLQLLLSWRNTAIPTTLWPRQTRHRYHLPTNRWSIPLTRPLWHHLMASLVIFVEIFVELLVVWMFFWGDKKIPNKKMFIFLI